MSLINGPSSGSSGSSGSSSNLPSAAPQSPSSESGFGRLSLATWSALLASCLISGVKLWGWQITNSQAVYSDFLESIVNIVAGVLAILVIRYSSKPADRGHPYGHGKIEYFSAAFEGGLIAFAAVMIFFEAIPALLADRPLNSLGLGAAIVVVCGLGNMILGKILQTVGRRVGSPALIANGQHIFSDFVTSAGVAIGLVLAYLTGLNWLDPLVAMVVGIHLGWTGLKVVRRSVAGLLDEEDKEIIEAFANHLKTVDFGGVIQIHHTRIVRAGRFHHIDAHAVVPEFWDIAIAHDRTEAFEARLMDKYPQPGELHLHVDPCRRVYCRECDAADCPIRARPHVARLEPTLDSLTSPEEPEEFR